MLIRERWLTYIAIIVASWTSVSQSVLAYDLFDARLRGSWTTNCSDSRNQWFFFETGFRSEELLCAGSNITKARNTYSVFMECRTNDGNVTYMGDIEVKSKRQIEISLTEYRGATGASDIQATLVRCE